MQTMCEECGGGVMCRGGGWEHTCELLDALDRLEELRPALTARPVVGPELVAQAEALGERIAALVHPGG